MLNEIWWQLTSLLKISKEISQASSYKNVSGVRVFPERLKMNQILTLISHTFSPKYFQIFMRLSDWFVSSTVVVLVWHLTKCPRSFWIEITLNQT